MGEIRIGGQAVMEGVMMKNVNQYAVAVRKPDNEIEVKVTNCKQGSDRCKLLGFPVIRGVYNFIDSLVIGIKTLMYSAEFYEDEEEADEKKKSVKNSEKATCEEMPGGCEGKNDDKKSDTVKKEDDKKEDSLFVAGTVCFSIILAVGLFMLLPAFLASLLDSVIKNPFLLGLVEGAIRLVIFLIYVVGISLMNDIKRTYMYHGAEHKTINCIEQGNALTVENVMKASRFHKRCGTSFLLIVMLVSILVFMCIRTEVIWLRLLLRVLLVPVIAGISYEFIRFAGSSDSFIADFLSKPGLWLQRITTAEPTPDMVEVAIKSVEAVFDWRSYLEEEGLKEESK